MSGFKSFLKSGHAPTLGAAFFYFACSCCIWVMNGAMAPFISEAYQLTPAQKGVMLSVPIFAGALMRFPLASKINKVTIQETGIKAEAAKDLPEDCKDFKMSVAEVRAYFKGTNSITEQHFNHTINWSPCYIRGSLSLRDGRHGEWTIQQYRGGRLTIGKTEHFLYCPSRCKAKALI